MSMLKPALFFSLALALGAASCVSRGVAQAEEYFSIGMAYFDMGKYADAEKWLNRARAADRTMTASEYNLGRIAFETGRYEEAALLFEGILLKDPENVMALKAAAYSRIKNGDLEKAEALYNRVLALVPESADDGYNYALVLYALQKYENCENVLNKYPFSLEENAAALLLLARSQKAQNKPEAADSYARWAAAAETADPQGLYEYAQALEAAGQYARALEQYDKALLALDEASKENGDAVRAKEPEKSFLLFNKARLLLAADPENPDGLAEIAAAFEEGFDDAQAVEALLNDERITKENRDEIREIFDAVLNTSE